MAKVQGPLMSMEARGKLGGSLVFNRSLGRNVVRQLVIPNNPQTEGQGDVRQMVGGLGKAASVVGSLSPYVATQLIAAGKVPSGLTWNSHFVGRCMRQFFTDISAYEAIVTELEAHTAFADWTSNAVAAGFVAFSIEYAGTTEVFTPALQLYMLAKFGIDQEFTGSPFDTPLASWTATEIGELVTAITNA